MKETFTRSLAGILWPMLMLSSCATVPDTRAERTALVDESRSALKSMVAREPELTEVLDCSAGYALFPNVGKGGLIVGGAFGRGTVYDRLGDFVGYARVSQASVGGVVGARAYALLLVFEYQSDFDNFKAGDDLRFGAEASAIALNEGTSATTRFDNGVAVFAMPKGGLMADASLSGQSFEFVRSEEVDHQTRFATTELQYDDQD